MTGYYGLDASLKAPNTQHQP